MSATTISVPGLVRIKPRALDRLGIYLARAKWFRVALMHSSGLREDLLSRTRASLAAEDVRIVMQNEFSEASFEQVAERLAEVTGDVQAIVGLGGGKALDAAKYMAFLAKLQYFAVPTSLSNDGFCSPQSSLTLHGRRRSLAARLPEGVVIDTTVCLEAPEALWCSGVGDLVAKITAVHDWKIAFRARGEPVNDLAALLSDASVRQFRAHARRDQEGARLLGSSLLLSGIAMEISGSSRPASGGEHLISHALDQISERPRLHGLQVGVASYLAARLQGERADEVGVILDEAGFWEVIRSDPFVRAEWLEAARLAPSMKPDYHTVLSERDWAPTIEAILKDDSRLEGCFV